MACEGQVTSNHVLQYAAPDQLAMASSRSSRAPAASRGLLDDDPAVGERAQAERHRRPLRADHPSQRVVRQRRRDQHAVGPDFAPALGQAPEQRRQPVLDARDLRDGLVQERPVGLLGGRAIQAPADARPRAPALRTRSSSSASRDGCSAVKVQPAGTTGAAVANRRSRRAVQARERAEELEFAGRMPLIKNLPRAGHDARVLRQRAARTGRRRARPRRTSTSALLPLRLREVATQVGIDFEQSLRRHGGGNLNQKAAGSGLRLEISGG